MIKWWFRNRWEARFSLLKGKGFLSIWQAGLVTATTANASDDRVGEDGPEPGHSLRISRAIAASSRNASRRGG
jgi:hypothetical protein